MSLSAVSLPRMKVGLFSFPAVKTTAPASTQNSFKLALCSIGFILLIKSIQSTAGITDTKPERCVELTISGLKTILIVKG